jgi:hypothetical protein
VMDCVGSRILRPLGRQELEEWAASAEAPEWWDYQRMSLLCCSTLPGFVVLSVPDVLVVEDVIRQGMVFPTPMARLYGCDSPMSADSYWVFLPVLVIEKVDT